MQRLAELEATAPKAPARKKMITEDSVSPPENKKPSLKDVFNQLSETIAPGQRPLPVLDPQNKHAGAGFVTSNNPAVQNMLKNLDPKDLQIVQAPGQTPPAGQQQAAGQQPQATAAGQPNPNQLQSGQLAVKEVDMGQAEKGMRKSTSHRGKFKVINGSGKTISVHDNQGAAMRVAMKNDDYSVKPIKEKKLDEKFASQQQAKLMYAAADDKDVSKKTGVSQKVAKEFVKKSHGQKVSKLPKKVKEGDIPSTQGIDTMGAGLGAGRSQSTLEGKDEGKPGKNFAKIAKSAGERYGSKAAGERVAGAVRAKLAKQGKLEEAKPDFLDLDKDGNKKEPMKKAAADKKKKKVDESMNHRISAARFEGKAHGLKGHAHCGKSYEDVSEMKAYHEGYKEGLDECYGQGVYETAPAMPAATVPGMASAAMPSMPTMEDEMEEGNAFTAALAKTPKGGKFSVGGKTFTDRTGYDSKIDEYAFESWDRELNDLLNEGAEVNEGLSVSISKGQQNSPDSVTITAQDQEAEHLLAFVKNAGLGLFGDDNADTHSSAMSIQPAHGAADEVGAGGVDIGVVDGHDGMMGLMQKLSGIQSGGAADYADEEGDEEQLYGNHAAADKKDCGCDGDCECSDYDQPSNEETCNECGGMMEAGHSCGSKEAVDEVESEDQMEFEVAEDNAPDTETAEHNADEDAEAEEDSALAQAAQQNKTNTVNEGGDGGEASEEGPESKEGETDEEGETVSESFASLLARLTSLSEGSGDKPKHPEHDKKDDKDYDDEEDGPDHGKAWSDTSDELKEDSEKEDEKAEKAGKKVTKDIEYDDKKDKKEKVDEWANNAGPGKTVSDTTFEQDIEFMTKVIAGGLNKPKSTGQTTIPVITGQDDRMHDNPMDWATLAGIKK
jgi:hypothetical protein